MPEIRFKKVDVQGLIESFPMMAYAQRLFAVEKEVEQSGLIIVPDTAKDKDMQTNEGWVVAVGPEVEFCQPGDEIIYARYSGGWCIINEQKYRVMNEEDILGKKDTFKEEPYAA